MPRVREVVEQVLAVRAFTENGQRAVQLTPDGLVVNYLRGDDAPYPGFSILLDEALAHCRRYVECYCPVGLLEVSGCTTSIPWRSRFRARGKVLRTEGHLTLNFQVPEDILGNFLAFDVKAIFWVARKPEHRRADFRNGTRTGVTHTPSSG